MNDDVLQIIMRIIAQSGDSVSYSMSAIQEASEGNFKAADKEMKNSSESIKRAHQLHTDLLVMEANGNGVNFSLLLVHASNHLLNAEISNNFAEQIIKLYSEVKKNV
jgi:PTS system cellobiose-specific IIA component